MSENLRAIVLVRSDHPLPLWTNRDKADEFMFRHIAGNYACILQDRIEKLEPVARAHGVKLVREELQS
jgi:hypothetical protein